MPSISDAKNFGNVQSAYLTLQATALPTTREAKAVREKVTAEATEASAAMKAIVGLVEGKKLDQQGVDAALGSVERRYSADTYYSSMLATLAAERPLAELKAGSSAIADAFYSAWSKIPEYMVRSAGQSYGRVDVESMRRSLAARDAHSVQQALNEVFKGLDTATTRDRIASGALDSLNRSEAQAAKLIHEVSSLLGGNVTDPKRFTETLQKSLLSFDEWGRNNERAAAIASSVRALADEIAIAIGLPQAAKPEPTPEPEPEQHVRRLRYRR
jgi:hypothetical protein